MNRRSILKVFNSVAARDAVGTRAFRAASPDARKVARVRLHADPIFPVGPDSAYRQDEYRRDSSFLTMRFFTRGPSKNSASVRLPKNTFQSLNA
jgi:hypothetical protein